MATMEQQVAEHYTHGSLDGAIQTGLEKLKGVSKATPVDQLASVDEFHMGGRGATQAVAEQLRISPGLRILDVGCGLGGTARYLATAHGCRVEGVDLTPEYIDVGNALNCQLGLADQIGLKVASALAMPFGDAHFDRATMLHVGMNIADKKALFSEIHRVTKPGGFHVVYDVMRTNGAPLAYQGTGMGGVDRSEPSNRLAAFLEQARRRAERNRGSDFRRSVARKIERSECSLGLHPCRGSGGNS